MYVHIHVSLYTCTLQFMCWMLSQLIALWENRHILAADVAESEASNEGGGSLAWRPWEHIQPHPKGTPAPQISQSGKYCVRLFWMVSIMVVIIGGASNYILLRNALF